MWPDVTARAIARSFNPEIAHSAIAYYYSDDLKDAVAAHAVEIGNSKVIAQLIITKHKAVKHLTDAERRKHMAAAV